MRSRSIIKYGKCQTTLLAALLSCLLIGGCGGSGYGGGQGTPSYSSAPPTPISSINLQKTGQTLCYDPSGNTITAIACPGTGQDGAVQAGVTWPSPRFTDNSDSTVSDNLTGLVWTKDAGTPAFQSCAAGAKTWQAALAYIACLNSANYLGYSDWRLPNINELESLVSADVSNIWTWLNAQGINNAQGSYWSSTSTAARPNIAWLILSDGGISWDGKTSPYNVWPVRSRSAQIYVADTLNNRIVRFDDMTGTAWTTFGSAGSGDGQFNGPGGLFVDAAGHIYVVDQGNSRIVRFDDMTGTNWTSLGTFGPGIDQFDKPKGLTVDANGRIYVVDSANSRIVRFDDMTGANWTALGSFGPGTDQFNNPVAISLDATGRIYVTDLNNSRVVRMDDMAGAGWVTFGSAGIGTDQFTSPTGVTVDASGRIYVVDMGNHRIVRMDDMAGVGWTTFGGSGQFGVPEGIVVDGAGHIYVSDIGILTTHIVRFDDMTGSGLTTFGSAGSATDQFSFPFGIFTR